jgi:hypothetical protein
MSCLGLLMGITLLGVVAGLLACFSVTVANDVHPFADERYWQIWPSASMPPDDGANRYNHLTSL